MESSPILSSSRREYKDYWHCI